MSAFDFGPGDLALVLAALLAVVALAALIRRERSQGRPIWRVFAWSLALGCLWSILARPAVWGPVAPTRAALLTPGASQAEVDRLRELADERLRFALPGAAREAAEGLGRTDFAVVPDVAWLARHHPGIADLAVGGEGLDAWDLARWPARVRSVAALGSPASSSGLGTLEASWPREADLGGSFDLRLRLEGSRGAARARLIGPGGEESHASLGLDENVRVVLGGRPKTPGPHLYRLEIEDGDGATLLSEPVGVFARSPVTRRILWLQESPSFEARHVKNWLASSGSEIVVRTRVSRDRFRTEFINPSRTTGSRFEEFPDFDLIVLDGRSLSALGRSRRFELLAAVANDGAGVLLLLPGEELGNVGEVFEPFAVEALADDEILARPRWPGLALEVELPIAGRELRLGAAAQPLVEDAGGRVLAATTPHGRGLLGVSILDDTYRWSLEGRSEAFRELWSRLIEQLSRARSSAVWRLESGPSLVDRPIKAEVLVADLGSSLPAVFLEDPDGRVPVAVRQDPIEPGTWSLQVWPRRPGWHRLGLEGGSEAWFHVADRTAWSAWASGRRRSATLEASLRPPLEIAPGAAGQRSYRRISDVPLFVGLLGALAALWLDERRRRTG